MEGISQAVAAIERELDEIAARSQKVKAAVRQVSAKASASLVKDAKAGVCIGFRGTMGSPSLQVPEALQKFWPTAFNITGISTEKKRKVYSLYGIWAPRLPTTILELTPGGAQQPGGGALGLLGIPVVASQVPPAVNFRDVHMRYQSASRSHLTLNVSQEEVRMENKAEPTLTCLHRSLGFARRSLMDPHSMARLVWSFVGLLCVIFDAISIPVIVSWEIPNSEVASVLIPMMLYWTIDIGASAQTGFYENGLLVQSPSRALAHYVRTWFLFDVGVVTFDWVMLVLEGSTTSQSSLALRSIGTSMGVGGRVLRVARVVRIVRLLRLVKLQNLLQVVEDSLGYAYMQGMQLATAVIKALLVILFSVHVLGCFWYMVGQTSEENGMESWLTTYQYHSKGRAEQYVACCHWILGQFTPAPMAIHAWNATERVYNVFVIFFSLPLGPTNMTLSWAASGRAMRRALKQGADSRLVVASCISRVSATIQQVIKLNSEAKVQQAGDRKRQVAMYLKINKISSHLCIRVLRFVDHSLRKHKAAPLDSQLLSQTLINELHMDRRGPVLRKHAMYNFLEQLSQRAFTQLCGYLELTVFEDKEIMFTRFSEGRGRYMPGPGLYQEEVDSDIINITLADFEFWAEISLFTSFQHTCTMISVQFNDTFLLPATALAKAIKEFAECCGFVYQYARCLQSKLNAEEFIAEEALPEVIRTRCCEATDAFQLKNLTQERLLQFFFLPKPYPSGADTKQLIRRVLSSDITSGEEIMEQLERFFPELHQQVGTHALFSAENERHRAFSCMLSVFWLALDRYEEFVKNQVPAEPFLLLPPPAQQDFVTWVGIRDNVEWIHGMLVYLAVKGLGRSKNLTLQLPSHSQQPDAAVTRLLERNRNVVPSVLQLGEGTLELLLNVSSMHECFVFGQFMQAENTPLSLQLLQQKALEHNDVPAYKLFLFSALAMLSGIGAREGCTGSPFLNDFAGQTVLLSLEALKHLQERTRHVALTYSLRPQKKDQHRIWLCYALRASAAHAPWPAWGGAGEDKLGRNSPVSTNGEAMMLFAVLLGTGTDESLRGFYSCGRSGLAVADAKVLTSWSVLDTSDRESLTEFFLADGIHYHACLFSYLPEFASGLGDFAEGECAGCASIGLPVEPALGVPLSLALRLWLRILLVELVEITWTQLAAAGIVTVNLADLAAFTQAVRSRSVFFSCLEHAKISNLGSGHFALNMTSKNWSRTEEVSNHDLGVPSTLRKIVRNTCSREPASTIPLPMAILDIERHGPGTSVPAVMSRPSCAVSPLHLELWVGCFKVFGDKVADFFLVLAAASGCSGCRSTHLLRAPTSIAFPPKASSHSKLTQASVESRSL
ncbi:KAT1 [Symbiodinium natans]|uniref:KAT1 protein n=1 Tax=Symbiodinium natans TaxID=878477 RepID=A0A812LCV1_9DINO|nr:KAT1 [Symbiodinium natans]